MKKLIDSFRQRFAKVDEHTLALRTLKLKSDADQTAITRSYRQLASQYHPDKGGDLEQFINVRRAYELLTQRQVV